MRLAVADERGELVYEPLQCSPLDTTVRRLYSIVAAAARERLGRAMRVSLVHAGAVLPRRTTTTLASHGVGEDSVVACIFTPVPCAFACVPAAGPDTGGTMVRITGGGFSESLFGPHSGARVEFGRVAVPCWRISDTVLGCRTPAHPPGPVSVTLLECEAARAARGGTGHAHGRTQSIEGDGGEAVEDTEGSGRNRSADLHARGGTDDQSCTFEFARLEHLYDAIFASTNAHCPIRDRADGHTRNSADDNVTDASPWPWLS